MWLPANQNLQWYFSLQLSYTLEVELGNLHLSAEEGRYLDHTDN